MPGYTTHLLVSSVTGIACCAISYYGLHIEPFPALAQIPLAICAGLAPDMDAEASIPTRQFFNTIAILLGLLLLCTYFKRYLHNLPMVFLMFFAVYFLITMICYDLFTRFTSHRGIFHSIPAALVAGEVSMVLFHFGSQKSQLALGLTATVGYLMHLIADDFHSKLFPHSRKSFHKKHHVKTTLKWHSHSTLATLACYLLLVALGGWLFLRP
jgi:membrane-bound metal-dependent hydrolase YbcI (DUF457 family)